MSEITPHLQSPFSIGRQGAAVVDQTELSLRVYGASQRGTGIAAGTVLRTQYKLETGAELRMHTASKKIGITPVRVG